jgi:hypothetical protein
MVQLLEGRSNMKQCKRCGGNLLSDGKGYDCLQCGCEHDSRGDLLNVRDPSLPSFQGGISFKADARSRLMTDQSAKEIAKITFNYVPARL